MTKILDILPKAYKEYKWNDFVRLFNKQLLHNKYAKSGKLC